MALAPSREHAHPGEKGGGEGPSGMRALELLIGLILVLGNFEEGLRG